MHIKGWLTGALFAVTSMLPAFALDTLRLRIPDGYGALSETLQAVSLLAAARRDGTRNPNDILAAARADYARLLGALYAEGHFGGTISITVDGREAAGIDPLARLSRISAAVITVQPGPEYRFSRAEVAPIPGNFSPPDGFSSGQPAHVGAIEDAAGQAIDAWRAVGNAKAEMGGQQITADHAAGTLAARIDIAPGPKLRFGNLLIRGETDVRHNRIRRIAGLPTGDRFDPEDLDRSARRLRDTGTFRSVSLTEADVPNPDGTLDIVAQFADQKPRRFGFGAEIESTEGLALSAFWLHRNLAGGAERLRIDGEIRGVGGETGGTDYELGFELGRPASPDARTDGFLNGRIARLDEPTFTSDTASLGLSFTREVRDELTASLGVEFSMSNVTDASGDSEFRHIFFPYGMTLDRREGLLNTNDGYYIDAEFAPFLGLQSSENGARFTFDARAYEDYGENSKTVIAARIQAGSIIDASITGLPNELRFFSGGGGTVRGQEFQSLDLPLPNGARSGGRSFLGLQAEVRRRVSDAFSVVGFYDWGAISLDSLPGSNTIDHAGAGLGVRYDTGIGPIRFDLGFPVGGSGDGVQFYIGIGQAF